MVLEGYPRSNFLIRAYTLDNLGDAGMYGRRSCVSFRDRKEKLAFDGSRIGMWRLFFERTSVTREQ
jgi:hypothetical protein